ncbi:hypothetical protein N0V95_009434 [Ascochyta clinopodiicola]|nr:hypothetical protein N0V95_009434 [Ascochyta clinopodiicola]
MRDSMGLTLLTKPRGQENMDRLVYLQFYSTIKSPFDVSKVYVFDNQAMENLALNPGYVRSLQKQGGGISFNEKSCAAAYVYSKKRAAINLRDSQRQSYGTREEHCVSLAIIDKMCHLSVSLQETIVIVIALRALRFCYGSNMLAKELLLFKDRWERTRGTGLVLEYLLALNLKQFDADVWSAMLAAHKTHPELSQVALEQNGRTLFCYCAMHRMFLKDGVRALPHIVTGNQMRITKTSKLLEFLFLWDDNRERKA